jgi:hypothetical protein
MGGVAVLPFNQSLANQPARPMLVISGLGNPDILDQPESMTFAFGI